jgi:uncharacterized protein YdeI (YjbR/CyaY-like superfamily)
MMYLYFANREEWRSWLENNHATGKEAWLLHYKKGSGKPGISYEDAVEEALCFGWIDGLLRSIDDEKYMLRYSPRRKNSTWSELNKKRINRMIEQGKMTEAGLVKIRQAKENGEWEKAAKIEELQIPPELQKALDGNKKAVSGFSRFRPSRQKQLIWWIMSARTQGTLDKRVAEAIRLSEENSTQ